MLLLTPILVFSNEFGFGVGNDPHSAYRFHVTGSNISGEAVLEVFRGKARVAWQAWDGVPGIYRGSARRLVGTSNLLIAVKGGGQFLGFTDLWLFDPKPKRLKLLASMIADEVDTRLSQGIVLEQNELRFMSDPPRLDAPSNRWFHRTWSYDRETQTLRPGRWRPGPQVRDSSYLP